MCLVTHSSTKLSQNVCLINIHIFTYWHVRYDCKLWNAVFLYIIDNYSCLHQTFTDIHFVMLICQMSLQVSKGYLIQLRCLRIFKYIIACLKHNFFNKLSQNMCLVIGHNYSISFCQTYLYTMEGRSVEIKSKYLHLIID